MLCYPINSLLTAERFQPIKIGPELREWMARVEARPAYKRGMQRLKDEEAKVKGKVEQGTTQA